MIDGYIAKYVIVPYMAADKETAERATKLVETMHEAELVAISLLQDGHRSVTIFEPSIRCVPRKYVFMRARDGAILSASL